ncbi:hypothetical protein [Ruegeria sp. HKCCA4008]|uniref:hypothetical protein n=1 Tax=Ruegeria sp. HKCCA4008 TaxID=2682999 RepID=UPI0014896579|nr:hypothetical protein [Ruegeria sp. HKCCA4008]
MNDWRKELTPDEQREIELEDQQLSKLSSAQRKRAQDAMRMASKRAGKAMPEWLTKEQKAEMLSFYLAAQKLSEVRGERFQVDHIVPLHCCHLDEETGANVHYRCGLHVPKNLRVIAARHNRRRSDELFTADPLIVPDDIDEIPF